MSFFHNLCAAAICIGLTACAGEKVTEEARTSLVATTLPDIISCAGKPDKFTQISSTDWVIQYEDAIARPAITMKGPLSTELDIASTNAVCHAVMRIHNGYVVSMHFTGPSLTINGPNGACIPMIKECLHHKDNTSIPYNYDSKDYLK